MINIVEKLFVLGVIFFFCPSIHSQSVILINGVPTQVQLVGDSILSIEGENEDYLSEYTSPADNRGYQYAEYVNDGINDQIAEVDKESDVREDAKIVGLNYFNFDTKSRELSEEALEKIKGHADALLAGEFKTVLLESFHQKTSKNSIVLVRDRLEACKQAFEGFGVPSNVIITNLYSSNSQASKVAITLR